MMRVKQPAPFVGAVLFGLSCLLLGGAMYSQTWSTSHVGKMLSGSAGMFRYCMEIAFKESSVKPGCGPIGHAFWKLLAPNKNADKMYNLFQASRILSVVALAANAMGFLSTWRMSMMPFTPRSQAVPPLVLAITAFVTSLLCIIFWGSVHKMGFKQGLTAETLFPHATLGHAWRLALFATISSGLAIPAAIVDLSLNTHRAGWAEGKADRASAKLSAKAAKQASGEGRQGSSGHYATVAQETGASSSAKAE